MLREFKEERRGWIAVANSKKLQNSKLRDNKALSFEGVERGERGSGSPLPIVRKFRILSSKL